MATTIHNSAYKIKVGSVEDLVDLVPEAGAIVFDESDGEFKGSDGSMWTSLSGGTSPVYTFTNGLTEAAGVVKLGGTLVENTQILGDGGTYEFEIRELAELELEASAVLGTQPRGRIQITPTQMLQQVEGAGGQQSQLVTSDQSITVMVYTPALKGFFWNQSTFQIYDQVNNKGIEYNADYSANFTDRSLVDKAYVDSIPGPYTFQNALTQALDVVELGGTLVKNTDIFGDAGTYEMNLKNTSNITLHVGASVGNPSRSQIDILGSGIQLIREPSGTVRSDMYLSDVNVGMAWSFNGLIKSMQFNASQMLIRDQQNSKGLVYELDYSANWTDHSLVTKKWVEDTFVPARDTVIVTGQDITNTYSNGVPVDPFEFFDTEALNTGTAFTVSIPAQSLTINEAGNYQGQFNWVVNSATDNDIDCIIRTKVNGVVVETNTWNSGTTDYDTTWANYVYFPGLSAADVITLEIELNKDADLTIKSGFTELIKTA